MKTFTQIYTFLEVVNRSSFAQAARHLNITPAAVSKNIHALEEEIGLKLIKRSTRRLELTEEGIIYFEYAKKIIESYEAAESAISEAKEEPSGKLKVICGPHFGHQFVIPHLNEFLTRYPKINLIIEFTQTIPDLEKENIDLILGLSTWIPINCIQRRLIFARNVLCASPKYLKKYGTPKKPSDLSKHHFITHTMTRPIDIITFKNGESSRIKSLIKLNDTRAMRACALEGIGIVELHDYIVENDLKNNALEEILINYTEQKKAIPLYMAYPQTGLLHIKVRKFIDFVFEKIKSI